MPTSRGGIGVTYASAVYGALIFSGKQIYDTTFFGISHLELKEMNPHMTLILEVSYDVL